jgi:hypothetical protein
MQARGYQGEFLTINPHVMQPKDWRALAIIVVVCLILQVAGRLGG